PSLQVGNPAKSSPPKKHLPQFLHRNVKTDRHRQTFYIHVMHAGGELRTDSNLISNERPLCVRNGHYDTSARCPLFPRHRTWFIRVPMSALCQKRTHALQQKTGSIR